ncbi:MAG: glutathione S-transferase [Sphingomonadales bacterium]|nr:glutathione S-transferase [Sphingomonadales bacterium]
MTAAPAPITITAFKWVPAFARGQVRDFRLRWMLKEVGWDYQVELIDGDTLATDAYRAEHPFGQVPLLREEGRPALFETGGIVLDIAERSGRLLPEDEDERALAKCWTYAALNSVEPFLFEVAADHNKLVEAHDNLAAWRDRCFARPAYKEAIAEQYAEYDRSGPKDMGWDEDEFAQQKETQGKGETK